MKNFSIRRLFTFLFFLFYFQGTTAWAELPLTVAEKSHFKATSRYADVQDFCQRLAKESPVVRLGDLGTSHEGRKLPILILADPPVTTAAEAARSEKLVVLALGNIHPGEADGKEALLMLARDLATATDKTLLRNLIVVLAPIFNADGNERIAPSNRTKQNGPVEGVGIRANAQGLDLNRDFVKLESPEVRALVRFFNQWNPAVLVDCHTTNGSFHRYTVTFEGGRCPGGDPRLITFTREELLPDVRQRLEKTTGYLSWFFGDFSADHTRWEPVLPRPRYSTHYAGLRQRIGVLCESYNLAPFRDRVLATRGFVRGVCESTAAQKDKIRKLLSEAEQTRAGPDTIPLRYRAAPLGKPQPILGFVEEMRGGRPASTGQPKEYLAQYMGGTETILSVARPYAYLIPTPTPPVVETLQRHGINLEQLREDLELDLEVYRVDRVAKSSPYQKHALVTLEATLRLESRMVPAGTILVRTSQARGRLAEALLEPQFLDGLATWNFFGEGLKEGGDFPVFRLPYPQKGAAATKTRGQSRFADSGMTPLTTARVPPLPEDRVRNRPITFENIFGSGSRPNFNGSPISGMTWLDDGEHYLQAKGGKLYKVHALTGRCQPFHDPDKLAKGLATLPPLAKAADGLARSMMLNFNPQRTGALFQHEGDLYFGTLDGKQAVRLTSSPGSKELISFSPDGKFVAFVRGNNLYVVDIATQTERALTSDGSANISNGKADWVYFEEIYYRDHRAYWWSPDSSRIAFLRFDDTPVQRFTVINEIPTRQIVETTAYPQAGQPNPLVKLGLVPVSGGVRWADLGTYSPLATLVVRVGWLPDSRRAYFFLQDRAQTWLDMCTTSCEGGTITRLWRENSKAWVDDPGPPSFLKDGSFLLPSARTGYNHLYRFDASGKLLNAVTSGDWETTCGPFQQPPIKQVDETSGWVYFTGKRDNPIASNLYRVKLDGSNLQRLTSGPGDHRVSLSPHGPLFIDTWSSHAAPTQVRLCRTDGTPARTLDTNPVPDLEEYRRGKFELVKIPTPDGFVLEGSVLKPPDFDPQKKYPVWMMIYAGPHMPTMHDAWGGGRVYEEMVAQLGFIVFHCDPRSASGKGHVSTWTAYRRLGIQELKDLETAVRWLTAHPWADAGRVGISGTSYGGFMTLFALTHSKLFAAGAAGAAVTDWRDYDTIYTERYMNTPQENPEGYDATSVVKAARNLHGKLLLIHGMMDDNVHVQNSMQLVEALQQADKDFELMVYPRNRHGFHGRHYQRLTLEFMKRALRPGS